MLQVHVLLVAPPGADHMTQPDTDQHKGKVTVQKTTYHTSAVANLPVQPLNDIVGPDASPVPQGKLQ